MTNQNVVDHTHDRLLVSPFLLLSLSSWQDKRSPTVIAKIFCVKF
jgi:hypothetical protein